MNTRLFQGFYFGSSQGLDKLSVIDELICRIGVLCFRVNERLLGVKTFSYQVLRQQVGESR